MPSAPTRLRRAAVGVAVAVTIFAGLTACAARPTAAPATSAPQFGTRAELVQAGRLFTAAHVTDDRRARTLTIVPAKRSGGLALFLHGWSQTRWSLLERPEEASVARALVDAGYVVVAADAGGKAWGDAASVADYSALIDSTQKRYGLRDVFLMGESMGGLATMQLADRTADVRAVVAWYPVCNLETMHQTRFQASIRAAWPHGFAEVSPVRVSAKPLMVWASAADTVVTARLNAARCVAAATAAGAPVTYFHTSGQHGDPSNFVPKEVLAFFDAHRTPGA